MAKKTKLSGPSKVKKVTKKKVPQSKLPKPFPLVAFGASAGGIGAFVKILKHLDSNLGMAYVLIMHLSPSHKSSLTEVVQAKTHMPVHTVKHGMELFANNIYVIPPNTFMSVVDGHLTLAPRSLAPIGNFAIDYFLTALAPIYKNNAIGIILSGTATDGTMGLKAIKAEGGITFAQDDTAEFSGMPKSAIDSGYVDFILPPEGIAQELGRLGKIPYTILPSDQIEAVQEKELSAQGEELKKILSIVKIKTGVDFYLNYKQASVYRRVVRRMVLNNFHKLADYGAMLKTDAVEVEALYDDFLINVTKFFRDPEFYDTLIKKVFPSFIKIGKPIDPIRIWVAGCATGEEAYSIAISLIEFLEETKVTLPIQIFASDLDTGAIEKARMGIYPASALQDISPKRLTQYFKKIDGHYQVLKAVRELCVFSQHNLLKDPPFSRINLISCQNVLIYLETGAQKKILQTFHYAIKPSGYLFLSKSETIGTSIDLFEPLDKKIRLYSRKHTKSAQLEFTIRPGENATSETSQQLAQRVDIEKDMGKLMLSRFVHPSVVIDKNMMIVQFFGLTAPYLSPFTGKATFNVLKMIREDLVIELRHLLQEVKKTGKDASKEGIKIYTKKVLQEITIEVIPRKTAEDTFFLVVFKETATMQLPAKNKKATGNADSKMKKIVKLEEDLIQSLEIIRSTNEEYETTYEELQANNEEILSSNEELQSVNEELETSKEELQSSNEELTTIVEELNKRNVELKESQDYSEAIIETMHGPLLVLTSNLQVRIANKAFYQNFKLTQENTEGHFIYDLGEGAWDIPSLREHLKEVFAKKSNFKAFEIKHTFEGVGMRDLIVNAYKLSVGINQKENLILLAFDDITRRYNAEASLLNAQEKLKLALVGDTVGTWWWNISTHEMKWSKENEILNGLTEGSFKGLYSDWENLIHPDDVQFVKTEVKKSFLEKLSVEIEYRIIWPDKSVHWMLSRAHPYYDQYAKPDRMVGVTIDYTERRMQSENLEKQVSLRTAELLKSNRELIEVNDQLEQFAFISSHDLQEPLRKIQTFANYLLSPEAQLNAYTKKYSEKINASAARMSVLLKDLLSFALLSKGDQTKMVKVDLNEIVQNVIKDFELIIEDKKAVINCSTLPSIHAHPNQINQLFHNLLSNALKFSKESSPKESPVITIASRKSTTDDFLMYPEITKGTDYISISVQDNGIGFNQKYIDKIFILFQRLNYKKEMEGTGIGLALCKKIVDNHGGFIFAESKENVGTTFTLFFPTE